MKKNFIDFLEYKSQKDKLISLIKDSGKSLILYLYISNKPGEEKEIHYFAQAIGYKTNTTCLPLSLTGETNLYVSNRKEQIEQFVSNILGYEEVFIIGYMGSMKKRQSCTIAAPIKRSLPQLEVKEEKQIEKNEQEKVAPPAFVQTVVKMAPKEKYNPSLLELLTKKFPQVKLVDGKLHCPKKWSKSKREEIKKEVNKFLMNAVAA